MSMLDEHGTPLMQLKPGSIAEAAIEDVRRYYRNKRRGQTDNQDYEQYAFVRQHVHKAIKNGDGAPTLLTLAIQNTEDAARSAKRMTRLIYSDVELMAGALAIVRTRSGEPNEASE